MLTGTALRCHIKPLQFRVWSGRLSTHSDHCSGWRLTGATAAADRTISFRQVAPQRQLDCRSGRSCRTKNLRRSCRTRGELAATQRVHRVERLERRDGMDGRHSEIFIMIMEIANISFIFMRLIYNLDIRLIPRQCRVVDILPALGPPRSVTAATAVCRLRARE